MPWAGEQLTHRQPVLVLVGPTAVGKTGTAIELGRQINADIIGADSRQVYQYMDIGTAKPTPAEQNALPHHLIDVVPPDVRYNVADFQAEAQRLIADIHHRGRLPMIVGGTGQYVSALIEGWQIPNVPPDPDLRAELEAEAEAEGWPALLARLQTLDPVYAQQVDAQNLRRVIRAIEVCLATGRPYSDFRQKQPPPYTILEMGLTLERSQLYERADQRVEHMLAAGLIDEVQALLERGYDWSLPAMSSLGYLEIGQYLRGEIDLDEARTRMCNGTHSFIRRQYTWFRKHNAHAYWVQSTPAGAQLLLDTITRWLDRIGL